jgi:hypothetical protein
MTKEKTVQSETLDLDFVSFRLATTFYGLRWFKSLGKLTSGFDFFFFSPRWQDQKKWRGPIGRYHCCALQQGIKKKKNKNTKQQQVGLVIFNTTCKPGTKTIRKNRV